MIEIGTISKLMAEREKIYKATTKSICTHVSDKLSSAFRTFLKAPDKDIEWTNIEAIEGTNKAVLVTGSVKLEVGDVITMDGKEITIDESNASHYNRFLKFAFPITMLEVGTESELLNHIEKMVVIGSAVDVTPEDFADMLEKISDTFHNDFMSDQKKLARLEEATKPKLKEVMGFDASSLSDSQVSMIQYYEKNGATGLN